MRTPQKKRKKIRIDVKENLLQGRLHRNTLRNPAVIANRVVLLIQKHRHKKVHHHHAVRAQQKAALGHPKLIVVLMLIAKHPTRRRHQLQVKVKIEQMITAHHVSIRLIFLITDVMSI